MRAITQPEIDQQVFNRYDKYCHGRIDRREFMRRAGALGAAALVMAQGLLPNYAKAQTVSFTDSRIKASYVTYSSPGANGEKMRGYLIQPARNGPWPAVQWLKAHQLSTKRLGATHGLPQQFDAALRRGGGETLLGAHDCVLQEEPGLSF